MIKEEGHIIEEMDNIIEHGIEVSQLSYLVGKELGLSKDECYELAIAGVVHDIGKLKLNKYIYDKYEDLTKEERVHVRSHSNIGYDILKGYDFSDNINKWILYHHENYDGSGYPENLVGDQIPLGARILRICDTYSALTSNRVYRKAFDYETAMKMMIDEIKIYDLEVFIVFQKIINEMNLYGEEKKDA
ncbi:putative nucleotidyltransferase with HDIG domain [Natranaerovirga pectinivora]|uniref:Putative nucleotidyltransferase with HDIG domain n=1 Tax=Natranaerovirga pectinivora TaxID=682400 RepID=A0A4R3MU34_9FIRM|nr:HD domain-containing phosphohydrolase [Natranaerovirga pectinivora]TCT16786.1 putative nucleotidyltransferase with HDIG domain [Natranaerovirga pectinivora]